MIERADEPSYIDLKENNQDDKSTLLEDGSDKSKRPSNDDIRKHPQPRNMEEEVNTSLDRLFDGLRPTSRFGSQKASEVAKNSFKDTLNTEEDVSITSASRSTERSRFHLREWENERESSELKIQGLKTELESSIAEKTRKISQDLARTKRWADSFQTEKPSILNKTYSFEGESNLKPINYLNTVSWDLKETDRRFTVIQEDLAEQGKEVEALGREELEPVEREIRGLGSTSKEVRKYERKALSYVLDEELYESIKSNIEKREQLENRFLRLKGLIESFYDEQSEEIEKYVSNTSKDLRRTTGMLEKLSDATPRDLIETLLKTQEIDNRILDDAEDEIQEQYQETVYSLAETAKDQYKVLERPLQHLERIEDKTPNEYFADLNRSEEIQEVINSSIRENHDDYIDNLVDDALAT